METSEALELAHFVSKYLADELDRSSGQFIPLRRDVAITGLDLLKVVIGGLESDAGSRTRQ